MAGPEIARLVESVSEDELRRWVERLSFLRHGQLNPTALEEAGRIVEERLAELGLRPERQAFGYRGRAFFNVVAELPGREAGLPPFLAGAHYDAAWGSPGADDNASAVAAMLVAAGALAGAALAGHVPRRTIRFAGFSIEEPQDERDRRCRHGSRHFARLAFRGWERYAGVFILESVGYADHTPGSQHVPLNLPLRVPDTGTFLGVVGNRRAKKMMALLDRAAGEYAPDLEVVSHRFPLAGWLVPATRMSDHAPFWDRGYPAAMLTDTAFLRNPNYHRPSDRPETLDYAFMANVTRALTAALAEG
jgi:Zn-dependent M28 family amino/carboxypeptidase